MKIKFLLLALLINALINNLAQAEFIVYHRAPESGNDHRQIYNIDVLNLILEKTKSEFGSYQLAAIPNMNYSRALFAMSVDVYPNLVMEMTYTEKISKENNLNYIKIPADFGVVGYRICFVSNNAKEAVKNAKTLNDLKKFIIGQGLGWLDAAILRNNGFTVQEIENYDSLFKMVASNRIDLVCRGINELPYEYEAFKSIKGLGYDESFMFVYPLPRFFYFNAKNTLLHERLEKGFQKAYADGSLKKLWLTHYAKNIRFANLKQRKIFYLENPIVKNLPADYSKYNIDPTKE